MGFVLCAGSLDESHPYCSRTCCQQSIKNAIRLKEQDPRRVVYVWFKEIRTFGLLEEYSPGRVSSASSSRATTTTPRRRSAPTAPVGRLPRPVPAARRHHAARPSRAGHAVDAAAGEHPELGNMLKVPLRTTASTSRHTSSCAPSTSAARASSSAAPRTTRRASKRPSARRTPPRVGRPGSSPSRAQGRRRGRRGRRGQVRSLPHVRAHLPLRGADHRPETKKATIEAAACQGCGVCVSECPVKAITLHHYTDAQIFAKEEALFMEVS